MDSKSLKVDPTATDEMDFSLSKSPSDKLHRLGSRGCQSLEQPYTESRKLRKQGIVTSISTGCLAAAPPSTPSTDTMPKISVASRSLHKSIHQLLKDDLEGRPGHRPPTPARQSLPNLLPVSSKGNNSASSYDNFNAVHENSMATKGAGDACRGAYTDMCRITISGAPRSASPKFRKRRSLEAIDIDLAASTRSEGWTNHGSSGVVPLPPICKGKSDLKLQESKLSLAKKTLEKLDNVLSSDDSLRYLRSHPRPSVHTHT